MAVNASASGVSRWKHAHSAIFFAFVAPVLVFLYVAGVLLGKFTGDRRLNTSDTIVVVGTGVALLAALWPEVLTRFTKVKLGGVEFEVLQRLDEKQQKQERDLDDIRFALTLLLPPPERKHLENLGTGNTQNYRGNHELRTELRRLRNLQLIESVRFISEITDAKVVDLKEYVRLTSVGRRYLDRVAGDENA
jgi:hypothetical protein